jgi:protein SCO1/2
VNYPAKICRQLVLPLVLLFPVQATAAGMRLNPVRELAFEQLLDHTVPLDLTFSDETGRKVTLGTVARGKPVVLALVYYRCQRICGMVMEGLARGLAGVDSFTAGEEYSVITVSIDPKESSGLAGAARNRMLSLYGRPGGSRGWHCLTGSEGAIRTLADSIGFRYTYDEPSGQYFHPTGLVMLTSAGRIARYFYGAEFSPRDLRLGLVDAAAGQIGSAVDQVLLFCYGYDPHTGRYTMAVLKLMRLAGVLTAMLLCATVGYFLHRERRRKTP